MIDWGWGWDEPRNGREEAERNGKCRNCGEIALVDRVEPDPLRDGHEIKVSRCLLCGKISSELKSM